MMLLKRDLKGKFEIVRFGVQNNRPVPVISMENMCLDDAVAYLESEGVDPFDVEAAIKATSRKGVVSISFKDNGELSYILEE